MKPVKFTIPLAPVTKKNSQRIVMAGAYPKLLPSKAFVEYQDKAGWFIPCKNLKINQPVNIKATFYMKTRRRVDISNLHSALDDILVYYGVLLDDSSINPCIVASTDGSRVYVDSGNPRTEVEISEVSHGTQKRPDEEHRFKRPHSQILPGGGKREIHKAQHQPYNHKR